MGKKLACLLGISLYISLCLSLEMFGKRFGVDRVIYIRYFRTGK